LTYDQCKQSAYDDDGVFDFEWWYTKRDKDYTKKLYIW
jgi:hypothetical protein